jgi:hypothetical protein
VKIIITIAKDISESSHCVVSYDSSSGAVPQ